MHGSSLHAPSHSRGKEEREREFLAATAADYQVIVEILEVPVLNDLLGPSLNDAVLTQIRQSLTEDARLPWRCSSGGDVDEGDCGSGEYVVDPWGPWGLWGRCCNCSPVVRRLLDRADKSNCSVSKER